MSHWEDNGKSDEWYTPKYIFDALECKFDLDAASPEDRTYCSVPTTNFITKDSLSAEWDGFYWLNAPFEGRNGLTPWLEKAYNNRNCIILTPDRTSTLWWQKTASKADNFLFVHGKIKFIKPDGAIGKSPSTGTTLFAFGSKGAKALYNAQKNRLGIICKSSLEY